MRNGKILHADSGSELIMDNAIPDDSNRDEYENFQRFNQSRYSQTRTFSVTSITFHRCRFVADMLNFLRPCISLEK